MAVYKVPQDVEADDKLIGPFSFRQFIYLIIVAAAGALAWVLSNVFLPLVIIPLPVILFFGALALPLRKDQPMETYLAALVSFYIKPRKRLWDPDGLQALIEITAPKKVERQLTKDISESEAERRFSYLADIVDSQGWAVRGVSAPAEAASSMVSDVYYAAQQTPDILDENTQTFHQIDARLDQSSARYRQQLMTQMQQAPQQPVAPILAPLPSAAPVQAIQQPAPQTAPQTSSPQTQAPHLTINPYPTMHQSVLQPLGQQPAQALQDNTQKSTSAVAPSPDIINLANNPDLSIETIAHEANRIKQKEQGLPDDEVVISLH
ncbi:MAG TPA: PrgI family protein [Candidatus Saccharimonadales bacterium]